MSSNDTFLAVFLGSKTSAQAAVWNALSDAERRAREQQGIAAWGAWVQKHQGAILETGGPLGKTKRINPQGVSDTKNAVTGYVVVQAESHDAAAKLFLNHPHFTIFPGDSVEIMEVLPLPGQR